MKSHRTILINFKIIPIAVFVNYKAGKKFSFNGIITRKKICNVINIPKLYFVLFVKYKCEFFHLNTQFRNNFSRVFSHEMNKICKIT